jgi:hypothetical protein
LIEDGNYRAFDKLIQPPFRSASYGSIVRATIVGRSLAGEKVQLPKGTSSWRGYDHLGCCSLLAIEEVRSVDPQDRNDLGYGASPDQPEMAKHDCGSTAYLLPIDPSQTVRAA